MTVGPGGARHVWIVGMPGSGKSAAGRVLAGRLGVAFVDLDREVERAMGRTVAETFEQGGEPAFRRAETTALCAAADGPPAVVATGGGAVLAEENRRAMRRTGLVLHLDVDPEEARARLAADATPRPLLAGAGSWDRLAGERRQLYEDVADATIHARDDGTSVTGPEAVADAMARLVAGDPAVVSVPVAVAGRSYSVHVGAGILGRLRLFLPLAPAGGSAFVVADQDVAGRFLEPVSRAVEDAGWGFVHLPVPEGEAAKTLAVAEALYRQLAVREAQRRDLVVALGGGSTGDLAGFVAATYLRGMPVVQVPTTLLAQVDAAIGGKTAVNLPAGKNLVGAFHQPVAVVADVETLATLPERELRSGLGEVAKYALAFDPALADVLLAARFPTGSDGDAVRALHGLVRRCVEIKAEVVSRDERDTGERLFLNYGHSVGHALERLAGFVGRSHGDAVAIGMVFAARLSERLGVARPGLVERHVRLLEPLGLPVGGPVPAADEVLAAMRMDKKRRGALRFVLLEDVGRPVVVDDVAEDAIAETLEAM
jgi:shikimate kinase / 3-dehydroquinate synthase